MEVIQKQQALLVERFRSYLEKSCNLNYKERVYTILKGTQLGDYQKNCSVEQLLTKYKITRALYRKQDRKKWHQIEKQIFVALISAKCGQQQIQPKQLTDSGWEQIAQFMLWDAEQCRNRWLATLQRLQATPWSAEEDNMLKELVAQQGDQVKWLSVSESLNKMSSKNKEVHRSSKCCRDRWYNFLDTKVVKGNWEDKEDLQILNLVQEHGKKWAKISKIVQKVRTQNSIKIRFHTLLKQERRKGRLEDEADIINQLIQEKKRRVSVCRKASEPPSAQEDQDLNILRRKPQTIDPRIVSEVNRSIGGVVPTQTLNIQTGGRESEEPRGQEVELRVVESMQEDQGWASCLVNVERGELFVVQRHEVKSEAISQIRTPYQMMMMGSPIIFMRPIQYP